MANYVAGQYSRPYVADTANPVKTYFIFDTLSGQTAEVQTLTGLQAKLGHPVHLIEIQFFRSPLAAAQRQKNREVMFIPPFISLLLFAAFVWIARSRAQIDMPNIYT